MKRQCFALDLKNDPQLISEYEHWHKAENGWPEIRRSIIDAGVTDMEIYRTGNRLFMIMDTPDDFRNDEKAARDEANPKVQEWEQLMWKFQEPLPWAADGEKWVLMKQIFKL
ncbi:L-rhamnose mutarotase [Pararcticibacter amylolyticus]|uniref:L-fucose mutarotase n=1 Tax=Pararcticibacter amylolyticus TaxID=2173175 RepID=A0A2U2PJA7_9SPHI|nr:L-rhamnose mutarotase [Pararcticibacter amylolyticus]PWG81487.1 L-fucose mutarotase [Pararcticibacter amylolyticus]